MNEKSGKFLAAAGFFSVVVLRAISFAGLEKSGTFGMVVGDLGRLKSGSGFEAMFAVASLVPRGESFALKSGSGFDKAGLRFWLLGDEACTLWRKASFK